MTTSRREMLKGFSLASTAVLFSREPIAMPRSASRRQTGETTVPPAHQGQHPLVPLPFDPTKLKGLSEKLNVSPHENNYGGALRNLNKVETALAAVDKDTPPFVVSGLKERELSFSNSVTLHELYFGNLGGDGKPGGEIAKALGEAYGTLARWEEEFRATGASLGGGSGWVILDLELGTSSLRTHWSGNHTQSRALSIPLLVMDMFEHAYQMDYGAAAAKYIDAFFENILWDEIERRFARASRAAGELQK